jgi:Nif-specific regulatory protein
LNEDAGVNNTLVAPIRFQNGILGMLHLYTLVDDSSFDESDLEYSLAVADTVGVALAQINKQKELASNLTQARKENINLREMLQVSNEIVGSSSQIQMVHHLIARAAEGKTALLIRGESGTGKELIARAVHLASLRKSKPFICLNCAAISETLLESELFGHEKGAFTGATDRKTGKFEAADTGTLFLDEIGEMSPALQAKVLRVLENNAFERVGGNTTITSDVRIITATNRDLEKEVAAGRFRHDLFFRLRILEIIVPPLRKRQSDIPILADFFLDRFCKETGRKYTGFHQGAMQTLMSYRWPGNVRELKNIIERAVVLGTEPLILEQDLLLSKLSTTGESHILTPDTNKHDRDLFVPLSLDDVERNHIIRTLEHTNWNKSLSAKQLGIERTTLDRKIKRYNIES